MDLTRYIKELLYQHECVTLPNFGAFLTNTSPIEVIRETGAFFPPRKDVSFNRLIVQNDGLLANYVASREGLNYVDALSQIEKEIVQWNKRIQTQAIVLPGIGELTLNAENNLRFQPHGKLNFDLNALGLKKFKRKPLSFDFGLSTPVKTISTNQHKSYTMTNQKKEPLAFTPEKAKKQPFFMRYAAVGTIAVSLMALSYYFGDEYLQNERIKSSEIAQKQIAKNVQEATFSLGSLNELTLNIPTKNAEPVFERGTFYSVIAGSFRERENAERKLAELKLEGFETASFAQNSSQGLYRVAFGRYKTKREAFSLLNFVKYSLEEEGWYLEEK